VDNSIAGSSNLIVGANELDHHFKNFNLERDLPGAEVTDIATVREGDPCTVTGQALLLKRGIEVGNIFKLGTKYSAAMNCTFLDQNGKTHPIIMGCYGIGVGRTMASVIEQSCDAYGPIWPISIAPYHVHICSLSQNKNDIEITDKIYNELIARGIEVIYDDRGEKPGFMFADADLLGVPFRVITSAKNLPNNQVEFKIRCQKESTLLPLEGIIEFIVGKVNTEQEKYR
jgi:prolyl-tRNA synthetase